MVTILALIWGLLLITVAFNIKVGNIFIIGDYVDFKDKIVATVFFLFLGLSMIIGVLFIFKGVYNWW